MYLNRNVFLTEEDEQALEILDNYDKGLYELTEEDIKEIRGIIDENKQ